MSAKIEGILGFAVVTLLFALPLVYFAIIDKLLDRKKKK